jgi:hypothetical protein
MSLPIVIVVHSPCTLHLAVSKGQAKLFRLARSGNDVIAEPPGPGEWTNPLASGTHTIALRPDPYHLSCPAPAGWRLTGGNHTIIAVPWDGEDPWPVPPLAAVAQPASGLPSLLDVVNTYFKPLRPR